MTRNERNTQPQKIRKGSAVLIAICVVCFVLFLLSFLLPSGEKEREASATGTPSAQNASTEDSYDFSEKQPSSPADENADSHDKAAGKRRGQDIPDKHTKAQKIDSGEAAEDSDDRVERMVAATSQQEGQTGRREGLPFPEKLLQPVAETQMIERPEAELHKTDLTRLRYINKRRRQASLEPLPTLPTGMNAEECLMILNGVRAEKGLKPLSAMPTGGNVPAE